MQKHNMSLFKRIIKYISLIALICIIAALVLFITIKIIIAAINIETLLNRAGIPEHYIVIAIILIGFIVEILLNKVRRKKEEVLLSTMTEEEREKYKKESSRCFEVRWWHESLCYIVCAFVIEAILKLFNFN